MANNKINSVISFVLIRLQYYKKGEAIGFTFIFVIVVKKKRRTDVRLYVIITIYLRSRSTCFAHP